MHSVILAHENTSRSLGFPSVEAQLTFDSILWIAVLDKKSRCLLCHSKIGRENEAFIVCLIELTFFYFKG